MIQETKRIRKVPLHEELERNYKESFLTPTLEKRKKHLASLRDLHKPVRQDEIIEHRKKFDEIVTEKII
jgi:hypothetical protein